MKKSKIDKNEVGFGLQILGVSMIFGTLVAAVFNFLIDGPYTPSFYIPVIMGLVIERVGSLITAAVQKK